MGTNQWREEDDWPLARTAAQDTSCIRRERPTQHAATELWSQQLLGRTSLTSTSTILQTPPPPSVVLYVATPGTSDPGPAISDRWKTRSDVLVYSTPPLEQDLEVTGPVQLELFAKSSAVDTDFTAKLLDVGPDGFAQNLTEGIVRARYRNSQEKSELMNPGQIYKFTVDLWATANVFRKGHRLRLEVSSSNFPRFDKNLNTGENASVGGKPVPATNTIYHDAEHPSALILPIVPTT